MLMLMLSPEGYGEERYERSFDFSKCQNIQEVELGVRLYRGGLPCISTALSTLGSVTSPRLSAIQLDFILLPSSGESVIHHTEDDLRRIADEVSRIESEFKGTVNVTVLRDPGFTIAFDALNVRLCGGCDGWKHC